MPAPLVAWGAYEALVALGAAITAVAAAIAARDGAKKLAQAIQNAQAKADDDAESKAAPVTSTTECKDCKPDPNCGKWLDQANQALYAVKVPMGMGGAGGGAKGLMQMLCEWEHGLEPDGGGHETAVVQKLAALKKALSKLQNEKHGCVVPEDVKKDASDVEAIVGKGGKNLDSVPHNPRSDFQTHCVAKVLAVAAKRLGR